MGILECTEAIDMQTDEQDQQDLPEGSGWCDADEEEVAKGKRYQSIVGEAKWHYIMKQDISQPLHAGCGQSGSSTGSSALRKRAYSSMASESVYVNHSADLNPSPPDAVPATKPVIKARRIIGKSSNVVWVNQRLLQSLDGVSLGGSQTHKGRLLFIQRMFMQQHLDGAHNLTPEHYFSVGNAAWAALECSDKKVYIAEAIQKPVILPGDTSAENARLPLGVLPSYLDRDSNNNRCSGYMLTFHGPWGADLFEEHQQAGLPVSDDFLRQVYDKTRCDPQWEKLVEKFQNHIVKAALTHGIPHVSTAIEMCLKSASHVRVHLHAMISGNRTRLRADHWDVYTFEGMPVAHVSFSVSNRVVEHSKKGDREKSEAGQPRLMPNGRRTPEAHYYLQFPKDGMLAQRSNFKKWQDFAVKIKWIKNQMQRRKISLADCIAEAIGSRDGARNFVTEVEWLIKKEKDINIARKVLELQTVLRHGQKQFKPDPMLVSVWKQQYINCIAEARCRFRPLVLQGPSRVGKSRWAMSFFEAGQCLVLDCQNSVEPNLRQFDPTVHKAIIFEEAPGSMVVRHKMLFQAGPNSISMGQSATNCNVYDVLVYGVQMIICTNAFFESVREPHDLEWLHSNIVFLEVTEPTWVQ